MKQKFLGIILGDFFLILYLLNLQGMSYTLAQPIARENTRPHNQPQVRGNRTFKKPQLPSRGIPTGRRRGGTSRSDCPVLDKSLTALVPGEEVIKNSSPKYTKPKHKLQESQAFLTPTISPYPTFWVYVPQLNNSAQIGEFILQNEQNQDLYRSLINLPAKSGIIGIRLPQQAKYALKTGQKYHWYFKLYCGEQNNSQYLYVDAWMEKIAPDSLKVKQLDINHGDEYQVFINNNLWYEAVHILANQQLENRQKNEWNKLLNLLNLSDLSNVEVLSFKANFLVK